MEEKNLEKMRESYIERGWASSGAIIDPELLSRARSLVEKVEERRPDRPMPSSVKGFLSWAEGQQRPQRLNQFIALQYDAIYSLVTSRLIGRIAACLASTLKVRLFNTALVVKKPGQSHPYSTVGWHCDSAYWQTCTSQQMLTAWIPLDDTTAECGTLSVLSQSHKWRNDPRCKSMYQHQAFLSDNETALSNELRSAGKPWRPEPLILKAGQVSFHHMYTLHGSAINQTNKPRFAIAVHLQDDLNRFKSETDQRGEKQSYVLDDLVRRTKTGDPDYCDPDICPVIWSSGTTR
ncbi:MAG: phytanoyl-CoA dioxygenase family protein [Pseudomonadota bacterium]